MKLFQWGKDGGKESKVWGFWFIEIKSLFSIVLLVFEPGSREAYHSHAFNAVTWFLRGKVYEDFLDGKGRPWTPSFRPKFTPRNCFHKVTGAAKKTYALSFRGPWQKTWHEYLPNTRRHVTLTNGRQVVVESGGEKQ